jgi:hypothetical protein
VDLKWLLKHMLYSSPEHHSPTSLSPLQNVIVCVLVESPDAETKPESFEYPLSKIRPSESPAVFHSLLFQRDFRLESKTSLFVGETAFRISNPTTTNDVILKTTKIYNVEFAKHSFDNRNWTNMPSLREGMDRGGSARANTPEDSSRKAFALQTLLQHSFKFPFKGKLTPPKALFREMASPAGTTNSGLVAAALIIRSRDGPRFVFHYPARPTTEVSKEKILYGTEFDEGTSDDEHESKDQSDDSDLEDGGYSALQAVYKIDLNDKKKAKPNHVEEVEGDEHYDTANGEHVVPWEHLFDFSTTDLESILTPSRAYHKKKFELSLDPLYFISYPMHIREDGLWKKKKARKTKKSKIEDSEAGTGSGETKSVELDKEAESSKTPATDNNSEDGDDHGGMTMFNVVFILSVAKDEADERIAEVYEHAIKKFNKALKHAQASSNYVWKESEMILGMKEKAREERKLPFCLISHIINILIRTPNELAVERDHDQINACCRNQGCLQGHFK